MTLWWPCVCIQSWLLHLALRLLLESVVRGILVTLWHLEDWAALFLLICTPT